jgi:hypothetical protein
MSYVKHTNTEYAASDTCQSCGDWTTEHMYDVKLGDLLFTVCPSCVVELRESLKGKGRLPKD